MIRKLDMAVLYGPSDGGYWETVIVEVEAPDLAVHHELEALGRKALLDMEDRGELDDFCGSYLFSIMDADWVEQSEAMQISQGFSLRIMTKMDRNPDVL